MRKKAIKEKNTWVAAESYLLISVFFYFPSSHSDTSSSFSVYYFHSPNE